MERIIEIVDHGGPDGWHSYSFGEAREKVVRCMDCKWFENDSVRGAMCRWFCTGLHDDYDGFCAWAKRRANED